MGILQLLLGASIAATPLPQAASQPLVTAPAQAVAVQKAAHPALWVVNDDDTIIYLFGTFHALDANQDWFEQAVKTAFSASDQLMLETLVPRPGDPPVALGPVPQQRGPMVQLAPSASFLATTKLVMNAGKSKGLSTAHGADEVLRDAADACGKPVGGLESFAFQLQMFNSMPAAPAAAAPQGPKDVQALSGMLSNLETAWSRGDVDQFASLLGQMRTQSPDIYKTMFVERNARWAHWIAERLNTPGTVFVAVGTGHLSGPDSVQNQLAMLGVKSARIN